MHNRLCAYVLSALFLLCQAGSALAASAPSARIVFRGGPIYTADPAAPRAEAVAVGDDRILYVGSAAGVEPFISKKTRVVDLKGQALFPGFIDANVRLLDYARSRHGLDLSRLKSYDEVARRVAQAARKAPLSTAWVIGWGWDQNNWIAGEPISMVRLQDASGSHPVCLFHATDEAVIVNGIALDVAGLADDPPDPPGGRFLRTRGGMPTGVAEDAAVDLIRPVLPQPGPGDLAALYREAAESCAVHGITQVHEMNLSTDGLAALDQLAKSKEGLPVRVYGVLAGAERGALEKITKTPRKDAAESMVELRAVGLNLDGGLDTRGAALTRPYNDEPDYAGHFRYTVDDLTQQVAAIAAAGFQPVLRATGDDAVRQALDVIGSVLGDAASRKPGQLPPRIESAAVVSPDDMARFKTLGVVVSMQPARVSRDYSWIEDRLGIERPARVHAWKSLMGAGAPVIFGSGAPATTLDPMRSFYAAITRQNEAGRPAAGWTAAEKLTREEALQAMTRLPAAAVAEENVGGSIAVGKRADLVVLSRDIMQVPEKEILSTGVAMTLVGGRIVHEKISNP